MPSWYRQRQGGKVRLWNVEGPLGVGAQRLRWLFRIGREDWQFSSSRYSILVAAAKGGITAYRYTAQIRSGSLLQFVWPG